MSIIHERWALTEEQKSFGSLRSQRGALPLSRLDLRVSLRGLDFSLKVTQAFVNVHSESIEAVYTFPLPARAAVSAFTMTCGDRVIEGELQERGQARQGYHRALQAGQQAAMVEEERPEIFTMTVGNLPAGQAVTVELELDGPLSCIDNHALFRFPLVVAPRYIPGRPLPGKDVGLGTHRDTRQTPDASRITPPTLLEGYPNPVLLSIEVHVDSPLIALDQMHCSFPLKQEGRRLFYEPASGGINQDLVLAMPFHPEKVTSCLQVQSTTRQADGKLPFCLTLVPPASALVERVPKQVVILLDRSSSMAGWTMAAARRIVARLVHSLNPQDFFTILAFGSGCEEVLPGSRSQWHKINGRLLPAHDTVCSAVLHALGAIEPGGGTEIAPALRVAFERLHADEKHIVLVTDGQVGNEAEIYDLCQGKDVKISCIGISEAVNAGFLEELCQRSGGLCQLVNNDAQLDASMTQICRRIGNPSLRDLRLDGSLVSDVVYQHNDLYPGLATRIYGRLTPGGELCVQAGEYRESITAVACAGTVEKLWARERVLQMEHSFVVGEGSSAGEITAFSLLHGVLCRFTAFLAVDANSHVPVRTHTQVQPVESPRNHPSVSNYSSGNIRVDLLPTEKRGFQIRPVALLLFLLLLPITLPLLACFLLYGYWSSTTLAQRWAKQRSAHKLRTRLRKLARVQSGDVCAELAQLRDNLNEEHADLSQEAATLHQQLLGQATPDYGAVRDWARGVRV